MIRPQPHEAGGWSSSHRRRSDGAIASTHRMITPRSVVERTVDGAEMLAAAYWREVERLTRGLVQTRGRGSGMELRVARGFDTAAQAAITAARPRDRSERLT